MAAHRLQIASSRAQCLPGATTDLPRRSSHEAPRLRRPFLEAKFPLDSADVGVSEIDPAADRAVRLEVGQAVDISEQIRRLEATWNSHDTAACASEMLLSSTCRRWPQGESMKKAKPVPKQRFGSLVCLGSHDGLLLNSVFAC